MPKRMCRVVVVIVLSGLVACSESATEPPEAEPEPDPDPDLSSEIELSGDEQVAEAGTPLPDSIVVEVTRPDGNPVPGTEVEWEVTEGDGSVSVASEETDEDGRVAGEWFLGGEAAVNRLEIRVEGHDPRSVEALGWAVAERAVGLEALAEEAEVVARLGDDVADTLGFELIQDARWLEEAPVLHPDSFDDGRLVAAAPGRATVALEALGVEMGELEVQVELGDPTTFSVDQPDWPEDGTVVVRGYRMDEVAPGAITVDGEEVAHLEADSASLRVDPGVGASLACSDSVERAVDFPGVASIWGGTVQQPAGEGAVSLAVGDTMTVAADSVCLRFEPEAGARYALAKVDRVLMDKSKETYEAYWDTIGHPNPDYTVTDLAGEAGMMAGGTSGTVASTSLARTGGAATESETEHHLEALTPSTSMVDDTWDRSEPWAVGDTFTATDRGEEIDWVVVREYPPNFVFAVARPDSAAIWQPSVKAKVDSVFEHMGSEPVQELYGMFGDELPYTSPGSGQLVVLMRDVAQAGVGTCRFAQPEDPALARMALGAQQVGVGTPHDPPIHSLLGTVAHELAHNWHCFDRWLSGPRWSIEGLADLFRQEVVLDFLGESVDSNLPYEDPWSHFLALPSQGVFTNGYSQSQYFLAHVALELRDRYGVPWREALQAVVVGSTEGWHGHARMGGGRTAPRRPGLTARVRALGDPDWDPVDARLTYVLSLAVDDRGVGAAADFGFPLFMNFWEPIEARAFQNIWDVGFYRGTLAAGDGETITGHALPGDNGYVLIEDPTGAGVQVDATTDVDTMVWRILRFQ